jgi:hypothetical protein
MDIMLDARRKLKFDLAVEVLRSFGTAKLPVTGASMLPSFWPGDILEVHRQSAAAILPGEVVVFRRERRLVAHRVVEKLHHQGSTLLVTRGDRLKATFVRVRSPALPVVAASQAVTATNPASRGTAPIYGSPIRPRAKPSLKLCLISLRYAKPSARWGSFDSSSNSVTSLSR